MSIFLKIYDLSNLQMCLVFISFFVAFGNIGIFIFRRYLSVRLHLGNETNEAINYFAQMIGLLYGILTGLIIVTAWQNYDAVTAFVSEEVGSIRSFQRSYVLLRPSSQARLKSITIDYVDSIVEKEWPSYTRGEPAMAIHPGLREIHKTLISISQETELEKEAIVAALTKLEVMIDARERRVQTYNDTGIPSVFWIILSAGALITLMLTFFVHFESEWTQYSLTTLYGISLGLVFFLMAAIDNPYRGEVHVTSDAYKTLKEHLIKDIY